LTLRPATNGFGSATITVTVSDGQTTTNRTFTVTVNGVNDPPTLNQVANVTLNEDAAPQTVQFAGITAGASNETQTLTVTAVSSNPALISNPTVAYTSPQATGTLTLRPATNASGSATITVTVSDGQAATNRTFTLTLNPVNDAPVLLTPARLTTPPDVPAALAGIQLMDVDAGLGPLLLRFIAARGTVILATNVSGGVTASQVLRNGTTNVQASATLAALNTTLAASGGARYQPPAGFNGDATIVIRVNDNGNTGSGGALSNQASIVVAVAGGRMDSWRQSYFTAAELADPARETTAWGDAADPDGDGRPNLMEYALALNPVQVDTEQGATVAQLADSAGNKYLTFSFRRRKNESQVLYVPEVSADQAQWRTGNSVRFLGTADLNADFEVATYQDLLPVIPGGPRFFRLRVTRINP
jgi:hypothetical protein